jgi:hypothetical protein
LVPLANLVAVPDKTIGADEPNVMPFACEVVATCSATDYDKPQRTGPVANFVAAVVPQRQVQRQILAVSFVDHGLAVTLTAALEANLVAAFIQSVAGRNA